MASVLPPRVSTSTSTSTRASSDGGLSLSSGRPSFSEQISALGARITRVISRDGSQATTGTSTETSASTYVGGAAPTPDSNVGGGAAAGLGTKLRSLSFLGLTPLPDSDGTSTLMSDSTTRSRSRGREVFSTGRGGAGNIRAPSVGVPPIDEDVGSPARGREPIPHADRITHVGRGGAGNIRSPSREPRDASAEIAARQYEQQLIENYDENVHAVSTGRGGAGNIRRTPDNSRSRSREPSLADRSQSRGRGLHSTGRGGAGNITGAGGDFSKLEEEEDSERAEYAPHGTLPDGSPAPPPYHSTGRGGLANVTSSPAPPPEGVPAHVVQSSGEFVSTGRGGAGNIRDRSRSASRAREREHGRHGPSALGKFVDRVSGHGGRDGVQE